jgi:hypothetical protein
VGSIQLQRTTVQSSEAEIGRLANIFAQQQALLLDGFLEPDLLAQVQQAVASAAFVPRSHGKIGTELCMTGDSLAVHMLHVATNRPALFELIERICGCPPVGYYDGRIYRLPPSSEFSDSWHDDVLEGRQVALSINLSPEPYEGGVFELREGEKMLFRAANTVPGDALLFRVRSGLKHRVTAVVGTRDKTAFAGWFIDKTQHVPYLELVRGLSGPPSS